MDAATQMLKRAVEKDQLQKYEEAKVCYEEGLELLIKAIPSLPDEAAKIQVRNKVDAYMKRAEELKGFLQQQRKVGKLHERLEIKSGQVGYGYARVFGKYIDEKLSEVCIEDAYIRNHHQICNLLRLCELLVKKGKNLKRIRLVTGSDGDPEQTRKLQELAENLRNFGTEFTFNFSTTLHDREITFNNGWSIKIGRGLDYFKGPRGKFVIGYFDMDLRECHETVIDVYDKR